MEVNMKAILEMMTMKEMVLNIFLMVKNMKENSIRVKYMEKEYGNTLMEVVLKAYGI